MSAYAAIRRVSQLWHFVLAAHLVSFATLALWPGAPQFFATPSQWLAFALGLLCDAGIIALAHLYRVPATLPERSIKMFVWAVLVAITVGSLLVAGASFSAALDSTSGAHFGFMLATGVGLFLVGSAASSFSRPAFFAFAIASSLGGTIGSASLPNAAAFAAFLLLMGALVRQDFVHMERTKLERMRNRSDQERALDLVRDFERAGQGWFWETDRHGQLVYISPTVAAKFGVSVDRMIGRPFTDLIRKRVGNDDSEERTLGFSLSSRTAFKELTVQAAVSGEERWWSISGNPIMNSLGNFQGFRGSGTDLTEMKRSEREINQLARYDTLTGLANRLHITELLERALRNHIGQPQPCALFLMDLDRFKAVNDTLGHPVGDQLLQQVAGRIRQIVGEKGHVGRLGGDEFQVVLPQLTNREKLASIANSIILSLSKPFAIEGEQVRIGASVGIAISEGEGTPSSALVRNADLALYAAKDAGRGVARFYVDAMHNHASERKAIEDALRDALGRDQLRLLYQPVVDVASERISGFEALIRWHHPTEGVISPAKFIPIAEEANLIVPIGEWIIRTACQTIAMMGPNYRVAVNVSPRQFVNEALPATIVSAVSQAGIRPEQLELEITEGIFLDESAENLDMFQRLKRTGVRLALDDFGTGYSALGYLKKAPFNKIKIDQSFVRGAADPASMNSAIISSIVSLAGALKMETTAEGVETHDELDLIRGLGCSHVQGYIYGKPMELSDALALLRAGNGMVTAHGYKSAREPRRRTFRTITVESGGFRYEAMVRNVSSRGALLEGLWNVPVGTRFALEFGPHLVMQGEARWSIENRMGVQFDHAVETDVLISGGSAVRTGPLNAPGRLRTDRAA